MFDTEVTRLFGVKHPIIQGGMQRVSTAKLVSAVANAGALGILSALTQPSPEALFNEIRKTRHLTDQPFGINLTLLPTRRPPPYEEYVDVIINAGVKVVETAGRSPEAYMNKFKAAGMKVIHKCTSIRHAKKAQAIGCDAITMDGFECAGHPGEDDIPSLILVSRATEELTLPIIACGGFANGRGLLAALALGAQGVCMGTRFLLTQESPAHPQLKQRLMASSELDTQLIMRQLQNTARVFKNQIATTVADMEALNDANFEQLAPYVSGERGAKALATGDSEAGIVWAGMSMGLIHDILTVQTAIDRIMQEATLQLKRLNQRMAIQV